MKRDDTALNMMIAAAIAATAFIVALSTASAQTSTAAADDTTMTTSAEEASITSTWSTTRQSRAEATPGMIAEAIQRSKARTEKFIATGTPERFGSEEPFTFDPTK